MGAKRSPEMIRAEKLVRSGWSAYKAAKEVGLTPSAIYMSAWYKALNGCLRRP